MILLYNHILGVIGYIVSIFTLDTTRKAVFETPKKIHIFGDNLKYWMQYDDYEYMLPEAAA